MRLRPMPRSVSSAPSPVARRIMSGSAQQRGLAIAGAMHDAQRIRKGMFPLDAAIVRCACPTTPCRQPSI